MIKSMTAYGRSNIVSDDIHGYVEIKSKNHKYRDIKIILPKEFFSFEIPLQKTISNSIQRGKIDIFVKVDRYLKSDYSFLLNKELLSEYKKIFNELKNELEIESNVDIVRLAQLNNIIVTKEDETLLEKHYSDVENAVIKALDELDGMKIFEGKKLEEELVLFMGKIRENIGMIQAKRTAMIDTYHEKTKSRILQLVKDSNLDESRLCQEAAYIADRTDITEEIARLDSHLNQFDNIIHETGPIGRKLDFLFQEINREINTIASKANDFDISSNVIDTKNELEKAREQAQNIE